MPSCIEEIILAEQVLKLIYPPAVLKTPLTNQLIRKFTDLTVNILRADVTSIQGWMEIQLVGSSGMLEAATVWLRQQGVEVQVLAA